MRRASRHSRGKEAKLELAREENKNLTAEVSKLKRDVEIWKGRLKTGRRLSKFNKEMKPLDDEAKELEPKYKDLRSKTAKYNKEINRHGNCVDSMISEIKKSLTNANVSFTEDNLANGEMALKFLKHLPSKEKASLRKILKATDS